MMMTPAVRAALRSFSASVMLLTLASARASSEAVAFLNEAVQAANRGSYMGAVVYQRGAEMETFRIAHVVDGGVEHERVATLDGVQKEMIRVGDQSTAYLPQDKVVRMRPVAERAFPSMTTAQVQGLLTYFTAAELRGEQIAGFAARGFAFVPKDALRYTHHIWADAKSGLLLRVRVLNDRGDIIEQATFTDLQSGQRISRHHLRSAFASKAQDWRVEVIPGQVQVVNDTGWAARELPPGFVKVREGMRMLAARAAPSPQSGAAIAPQVPHLLFSDGIATISVFIETAGPAETLGMAQQGTVNVYRRQLQDVVVTALGQTPPPALKAIADSMMKSK